MKTLLKNNQLERNNLIALFLREFQNRYSNFGKLAFFHTCIFPPNNFLEFFLNSCDSTKTFYNTRFKRIRFRDLLDKEVYEKYCSKKKGLFLLDIEMPYKLPGNPTSETHLNLRAAIPISLNFAQTIKLNPQKLWISPAKGNYNIVQKDNRFQYVNLSVTEQQRRSETNMRPVRWQPAERDAPPRKIAAPPVSSPPHPGKAVNIAAPGQTPAAVFGQWIQQRRISQTSVAQSLSLMVLARNTESILLRELISRREKRLQSDTAGHTGDRKQGVFSTPPSPAGKPSVENWLKPGVQEKIVGNVLRRERTTLGETIEKELQQFTVIRAAQQQELPPVGYAYTQPQRRISPETQTITKVQEKQVVKLIQKEVQEQMKSRSLIKNLSRTDYRHIAETVYTSLARQLMVEKERMA